MNRGRLTHGHARKGTTTKEYRAWHSMRCRCSKPLRLDYPLYGGRGISVCSRWNDFEAFLEDMGFAPSPAHTIDRKNTDGNYEPSNCRWATPTEQARNRRNSIQIDGMHILEWCEAKGLPYRTVLDRYRLGDRGDVLARPVTHITRWHGSRTLMPGDPLPTADAARYLDVPEPTMRSWRRLGTGPAYRRLSKHIIVYDLGALDAYKSANSRKVVLR